MFVDVTLRSADQCSLALTHKKGAPSTNTGILFRVGLFNAPDYWGHDNSMQVFAKKSIKITEYLGNSHSRTRGFLHRFSNAQRSLHHLVPSHVHNELDHEESGADYRLQ